MMLAINFKGTCSFCGKRHCPSSAILAERRFPSLSSTTVLVLLLKRGEGSENQNHKRRDKQKREKNPFLLFMNLINLRSESFFEGERAMKFFKAKIRRLNFPLPFPLLTAGLFFYCHHDSSREDRIHT